LAADLPLVESGTAGYLGQVTVIKKGVTECYECQPKPHQKTYPGCTIRNTPSEPVHCIVWAKHLFNQLFGEADPDEDVSPDTEDPEAAGDAAGEKAAGQEGEAKGGESGNVERKSTRGWAEDNGYNTQKLFQKFFNDDILYLLSMDKLWTKRRKPNPLDWDCLPEAEAGAEGDSPAPTLADQKVWSVAECARVMDQAVQELKDEYKKRGDLVWDKDDLPALNFVTACANIRMHIFNIGQKSRFEVKSMAGNIIPAIATTNAVIAGCIVMEALKILAGKFDCCKTVYLRRQPNPRKKILVTEALEPPNPKCYVCAEKPEVQVKLNLETFTVKSFEERILKGALNMIAPDAEIEGKGIVMISSDPEDGTDANNDKSLSTLGLVDGSVVTCDDFLQNYNLKVYLWHADKFEDGSDFLVTGDKEQLKPKEPEEEKKEEEPVKMDTNGTSNANAIDVDDDIVEVVASANGEKKRPAEEGHENGSSKKARVEADGDDVVFCEEKSAADLKKSVAPPTEPEDGVVCLE